MIRFWTFALFLIVFKATAQQNFVLTESKLAQDMGLSKKDLEAQSKLLERYIAGDKKLVKKCKTEGAKTPSLCRLVTSLEVYRIEEEKNKDSKLKYSSLPTSITKKTFNQAQRANPNELLETTLKQYSSAEVMSWLPKLMNTQGCPQNLLLASLRMYEIALPSPKAQASLEVGYQRAMRCLSEKDPFHELTHQRQGFLRFMWGDIEGAQRSLKLALQSDNTKARESTLFWLGYMEKSPKVKKVYWDHLIEAFPLSFHALSASKLMGKDPYEDFLKKPLLKPQRKAKDSTAQVSIYWLEALYMYNKSKYAVTLSYRVAKRFQERFSAANLAYVAALADKYSLPGAAMQLSAFLVGKNAKMINAQTLKFIYPTPFGATFERIAKKVDPLLTLSVAKQESGFNPFARSPANARGLLQILPSTAAMYQPRSQKYLYDIDTNVEVGGKILADLIHRLGRTDHALAAYNAGPHRVEDWKRRYSTNKDPLLFIDLIPYNETRGYVANVLRNHYWYTSLYGKSKGIYR